MLFMDLTLPVPGTTKELFLNCARADIKIISKNLSEIDWARELQRKVLLLSGIMSRKLLTGRLSNVCLKRKGAEEQNHFG